MQSLSSENHKIGVVDTQVEAAACHVDAGTVVREGAELESARDYHFGVLFVNDDLLHLFEFDITTIDAFDLIGVVSFESDITTRRGRVDGERLPV